MNTPICDFVRTYAESDTARLHMPGHKGNSRLGFEKYDITEIEGADELFAPEGIIAESEANASALFGTGKTLYSAEGSSLCIRAMLMLAAGAAAEGVRPVVLAGRNVHRSFITACALLDLDVDWLWPEEEFTLCSCNVTAQMVRKRLQDIQSEAAACGPAEKVIAVYVTSPDYLGNILDIKGIADAAHEAGVPLLVDNAHGAYLKFLGRGLHPMELGADMCCDSAHKTLPVITGGAYLHISKAAAKYWAGTARYAMSTFASTSPSYLILQSLDNANAVIPGEWSDRLEKIAARIDMIKSNLAEHGLTLVGNEPMKLTCSGGSRLGEFLRENGIEPEYVDPDYVVLMFSPDTKDCDVNRIEDLLLKFSDEASEQNPASEADELPKYLEEPEQCCSIRRAIMAPAEDIPVEKSAGRIMASESVSCPPAVSVIVSGERISDEAVSLLKYYGRKTVRVLKQ